METYTENWNNLSAEQKIEFYSTGATIGNPEPKWNTIIKEYPESFEPFIKPNGRNWDWPRIQAAYHKIYPGIPLEQVKHHFKLLKITIAYPFPAVSYPELKDYPKDFSDAVNGNKWDWAKIVELYDNHGHNAQTAISHFKNVLKPSLASPTSHETLSVPSLVLLHGTSGNWRIPVGEEEPTTELAQENWLTRYLFEHYPREKVLKALWGCARDLFEKT